MLHKYLCLALVLLGCYANLLAQQSALDLEIERAQVSFDSKKYNTAANLYKKIYPKVREEEKQNKILYMIAESYRRANNFKQAFDWYEKLVNTKYPDPRILYSYGLLLKNFEKYDDAARQFNDFLFENANDANAKREQASCAVAQEWKNNPAKFEIKNLTALNTPFSDYAPFYTSQKLVWASSRPEATGNEIFEWTGQKCSDFFESAMQNGNFTKPKNVKGGINSNFNEGAAWLDSTASNMYFTQCNGSDGHGVNCKIYESHLNNGTWSTPIKLPFCSDSFSVGHPSMTTDGKRMYFSSNMPGTLGEKDIYYIDHNPNTESWGAPVNLGLAVNTTDDDMFPFVDDSNYVYFSSKGRTGMGGLDVFRTRETSAGFTTAENLKSPINSGGDDFGISFVPFTQRKTGQPIAYYSSNREGGAGDDDVYSITVKPFIFIVRGKVFEKGTMAVIPGAKVDLTDGLGTTYNSSTSGNKGDYSIEIPMNQSLMLMASKTKYFSSTPVTINSYRMQNDSVLQLDFILDQVPAEDVEFTLLGIYYDLDKYDLRPKSKEILDSLTMILRNNPALTIELASHTDSRAPADYNIKLSQKRAQVCVDYLVKNGIARDRLTPVGYGETRLVNDCADGVDCTEEEHQQNRRTTFRVLKMDYKGR